MKLTAEQRYRQAMRKAQIFCHRQVRLMMEGKQQYAEGGKDRDFLIAEIDRAYKAGFADGSAAAQKDQPL